MAHVKSIAAANLKQWLDEGRNLAVVDVLPPEYFAATHIPGAVNHCVYQVVFLSEMEAAFPDKARPIVVYSASHHCHGAQDAAEKLLDAGYEDVTACQDGLAGWKAAGLPLEGDAPEPLSPSDLGSGDFSRMADPAASRIEWIGRSRNGRNSGTVPISQGELRFKDGRLVYGFFELDLTRLANENIPDPSLAAVLIAHLQSRDFFLVDVFPTARFETTHVTTMVGVGNGEANFDVEGQLTLRGVTRDLRFPATVERLDDGRLAAEAHFDLDRTCWGASYGSGRLFEKLGMHLVHDIISIQLRVVTQAV
ncbi:YceI family protein [Fundidesulfovibrio terrae]|uniref:YceI family protein n=1 Tax=Fundidesulfovibrio terrae TaxID=2922866 RepID=UPI001FAFC75F|nr:YceI family protein [Fundidesulfovibrio terrae]